MLKERGIAGPKPLFFPHFFFFYSGRRDVIIYTTRAHNVVAVTSSALYKTDCTRVYNTQGSVVISSQLPTATSRRHVDHKNIMIIIKTYLSGRYCHRVILREPRGNVLLHYVIVHVL